MSGTQAWTIDLTSAVAEDFGDEIVLMHTGTGVFYSLTGRAADLWRAIEGRPAVADTDAALAALPEPEAVPLRALLAELEHAGVLVPFEADPGATPPAVVLGSEAGTWSRNADYDDLIRLDPIHDVDDRGWPFA